MSSCIERAWLALTNLRGIWSRPGVPLSIKGRVSQLYQSRFGYVTRKRRHWKQTCEDFVFEHRCLCGISRIWWENLFSSLEAKRKVLGPRIQFLKDGSNVNRLRYLWNILHMPLERVHVVVGRWVVAISQWSDKYRPENLDRRTSSFRSS